jgi:hypothetical protein
MKYTLKFSLFTAVTAVVFMLYSCNGSHRWGTKPPKPTGKNIVCVVDFSDSKNATERMQFYMHVIKNNIIPTLGQYDKITVIPIDKTSITNSSDILLKDLSSKEFVPENASPVEEDELTASNLKKYIDTLQTEFEKNFQLAITSRSKDNHGTDIFGALSVVQIKFKDTKDNYLIMLSDMMNWSNTLKMEPADGVLTNGTLSNCLTKIPNYEMPNTTALVLTAEQVEVSPEHFQLVKSFWTKYFEKNKIQLFDYNSASIAKLNEMMAIKVVQQNK